MDFSKTVDLIIRDLEEAREIIDDLKNYPGVPVIQVEMAKSKCRNAAEVIALFKSMPRDYTDSRTTEEQTEKPEIQKPDLRIQKPDHQIHKASVDKKEFQEKEPERKEAPRNDRMISEPGIFADTFGAPSDNLNEKLGGHRDTHEIPDYFKSNPLATLSQAIGINDRFLFIRELFNGNSESYNEAIRKIDEAKTLTDARAVLAGFSGNKPETEVSRQLYDLLKRKFSGNE